MTPCSDMTVWRSHGTQPFMPRAGQLFVQAGGAWVPWPFFHAARSWRGPGPDPDYRDGRLTSAAWQQVHPEHNTALTPAYHRTVWAPLATRLMALRWLNAWRKRRAVAALAGCTGLPSDVLPVIHAAL